MLPAWLDLLVGSVSDRTSLVSVRGLLGSTPPDEP